jgi:hypothetical protein
VPLRPSERHTAEVELAEALATLQRESKTYLSRFRAVRAHPVAASGPIHKSSQSRSSDVGRTRARLSPAAPIRPGPHESSWRFLSRLLTRGFQALKFSRY